MRLVRSRLVPLSPLLFCWWAELADRSSGTAMGSSASSDASLAGGLSLPGETHTSKHPSLTEQARDATHSGEAKLPPGVVRPCLWPIVSTLCTLRLNHAVGKLLPGIWAISWASSVSMRCRYSNGREMEI